MTAHDQIEIEFKLEAISKLAQMGGKEKPENVDAILCAIESLADKALDELTKL